MEKEIWKDIVGYENMFKVSNFGRIIQKPHLDKRGHKIKEKIRSTKTSSHNYESFSPDCGKTRLYTHRVVAMAFCDNPQKYKQVNHIDGNTKNNKASNLEWCSALQNVRHSRNILKIHPEDANKKRVYCVELQKWFDSVIDVYKFLGLSGSSISNIINKNNKVVGCYHFTNKEVPYIKTKYTEKCKKWVICEETGELTLGVSTLAKKLLVNRSSIKEAIHRGYRCKGKHYRFF